MAVSNTGALFKSFTFDSADSRDYGVYITGAGVYNAPSREVEMISIPGRNGAFALDKGRFENIEVTYPAGIFANSEADFADGIASLRNLLCSKRGYCRLTDDYNPNEYRLAIYKSGLEVEPTLLRAGEFEITFECMPQRYLVSGETEISVSNNQTITNPTLFDAKPLIKANGYGDITVNGYPVSIQNEVLGYIVLDSGKTNVVSVQFDGSLLNNGDAIYLSNLSANTGEVEYVQITSYTQGTATITKSNATCHESSIYVVQNKYLPRLGGKVSLGTLSFTKGTSGYVEASLPVTVVTTGSVTVNETFKYRISFNGTDTFTFTGNTGHGAMTNTDTLSANSTVSALGNPTYLDCDLGVCYKYVNGEAVSLDHLIDLGTDMPVLSPGSNTITKSNTITSLKIVPRWWKI